MDGRIEDCVVVVEIGGEIGHLIWAVMNRVKINAKMVTNEKKDSLCSAHQKKKISRRVKC